MVGDGDSAAEVALALAERNRVTIFSRRTGFFRMNDALQSQVNQKIESKEMTVYFSADLERIEPDVAYLLVGDHRGAGEGAAYLREDWGRDAARVSGAVWGDLCFAGSRGAAAPGCPLPVRGARPVSGWFSGWQGPD